MRREQSIPKLEDGFLMRICKALRMTPRELARALDVPYKREFEPLLRLKRSQLVEIDRHDMWWTLKELVGRETAYLMAIQNELDSALQKDRVNRIQRVNRVREYYVRDTGEGV